LVPEPEPEDDPLLVLGRLWLEEGDRTAATQFKQEAEQLLRSGDADTVIEVCQRLIGETQKSTIDPELQELALRAHRSLGTGEG
jgi:hypothetical protein